MSLPFEIPPPPEEGDEPSPFTPTFGVMPPLLADRQNLINDFAYGIDSGPGAAGRATLVTGQRGVGKSVLLSAFRQVAESRQWMTLQVQATPGFVDRLTMTRIPELLAKLDTAATSKTQLTGVTLPFGAGGVTTRTQDTAPIIPDFEHHLMRALGVLAQHGTGLLLTIDEVHRSQLAEIQQVTDALAAAFAEGAPLALAAAGLPETINGLVNDDVSTFLRRSARVNLANLTTEGAQVGLQTPIHQAGKEIEQSALNAAVTATGQYPYLVQLLGDTMWRIAGRQLVISDEHVQVAAGQVMEQMFQRIHEPTIESLPPREREYLLAMSEDDEVSQTASIAKRMGINVHHAGTFRDRLMNRGLVEKAGWGELTFAIPYTAAYLRTRIRGTTSS